MIDYNYENISITDINEDFLDENIPRDLLALYRRSAPYPSQRNPSTMHGELRSADRRSKAYDYGKAEYRVISADDAIQRVKNNKEEVQNLRIIFNNNLVEYEVRDNGSIYAIYRSGDRVVLNDKIYKNVGYAPWQQVIRAAEKIYWRDEYSRKLSPEKLAQRSEKSSQRVIYKGLTPEDPGYDPHAPYKNLTKGSTIVRHAVPDTGDHKKDDQTKALFKALYTEYDLARKALKKLEAEKDAYDEEEYAELKAKFEEIKKDSLKQYNDVLAKKRIHDTKKIKEISLETHKFNQRLAEYTRAIEAALTRSYELKKRLDKMLVTTANNAGEIKNNLSRLRQRLNATISNLNADNDELEQSEAEAENANAEELRDLLNQINEYKANYVNTHLTALGAIDKELKDIEETIATYRPNTTARKARKLAAQTKEMSDDVLNVIEFVNF